MKRARRLPIKDWEEIQEKLMISNGDFMDELPEYVKDGIARAQKQASAGESLKHDEVTKKSHIV
jgi:hypothetical protein